MKLRGSKIGRNVLLVVGVLLCLINRLSFAQEYPTKPINLLVSYSGNPSAFVIRANALVAEKFLGQPFVISENGGGGGTVALGIVAKQKPDGYHLVGTTTSTLTRIPQLRSVHYKLEEFIPIMHFGAPISALVVRADSPWKTLKEFVEYAKKNPGKVTYTAIGAGTALHLAMEFIVKQEGIQWTFVPYTTGDPIIPLLGGHVTACSSGGQFIPHVKAGKVRVLATHGEQRMKDFPEVPTFRECGYDFVNETRHMFAAPKGTSLSIVKKLEDAFRRAMDAPEFIQVMDNSKYEITYRNHEDLEKYLEEAYTRTTKMIIDFKIPREMEQK